MSRHALVKVVLIAAIILISISADTHSEQLEIWAGAGAGPSSLGFGSAHLNASLKYRFVIFSIRRMNAEGIFLWGEGKNTRETGLMLGVVHRDDKATISLEAGIGWLKSEDVDSEWGASYTVPLEPAISLAIGSQIIIGPWKYIGVGIYPYLNINEYESYGGVHFTVYFGMLRN